MEPLSLPRDHFEARKAILGESAEERMSKCVQYIKTKYERRNELEDAVHFCFNDLMKAPSSEVDRLAKVGFFPWVEASKELDQSLSLILLGHYKHAYDSFRRAVDLVVTGAFFVSRPASHESARNWMESNLGTPNFKRACEKLAALPYFDELNTGYGWIDDILSFYWCLSDVVHVKGVANSYNEICPVFSYANGIGEPSFSEKGCKPALDRYLQTVEHVATVVAASNPFLLVGLELDMKFGLNPPASGFFYPKQSERLLKLVPERYRPYFVSVRDTDETIGSVLEWFESLPDITDEQVREQARLMGFE